MTGPALIVFSGLPGTGKSTLAKALASTIEAVYVRIDSVEDGLFQSALAISDAMDAGYRAAWAVAADNIALGRCVVGDSVNPVAATRSGWRHVAHRAAAEIFEIEVVCSDSSVHRSRVERRHSAGIGPNWTQVLSREYTPRTSPRLIIDTGLERAEDALIRIVTALEDLPRRL